MAQFCEREIDSEALLECANTKQELSNFGLDDQAFASPCMGQQEQTLTDSVKEPL